MIGCENYCHFTCQSRILRETKIRRCSGREAQVDADQVRKTARLSCRLEMPEAQT
jgi:hypothetical protein